MNNKTAVTSEFGSLLITHHRDIRESVAEDSLIMGHCESTKRGLFRRKTVQRPVTLSATEILQHVAVYAEVGSGADYWLMDKACQAMRLNWAVLHMDFMWSQGSLNRWNSMVIPSAVQSQIASNNDLAELLAGNKAAYLCADNATVPALACAVSNIMATTANDQRPHTLIILNGMPEDDASMEAVTKLVTQCRAAKICLILRFQEHQDTDFYAMLDANIGTKVEFTHSPSLGIGSPFPPCEPIKFNRHYEPFLVKMEHLANSNGRANHFGDMVTIKSLDLMNLIRIVRGEHISIGINDTFASSDSAGLRKKITGSL